MLTCPTHRGTGFLLTIVGQVNAPRHRPVFGPTRPTEFRKGQGVHDQPGSPERKTFSCHQAAIRALDGQGAADSMIWRLLRSPLPTGPPDRYRPSFRRFSLGTTHH
jgi:hypothetical protein